MDKNKKWYWIGGGVALLAVIGFAFVIFRSASTSTSSSGTQAKASLTVWGTFEDSQNMAPFIAAFKLKNPNVSITYTQKDVDTYESDLINALASGTGPDIFAIHNDWLPAWRDKLAEAPASIISTKSFQTTFVDVASQDFVADNKVFAAPLSVDSLALFYNKNILGSASIATPAKTWDDLKFDAKRITGLNPGSFISRSGVALGTSANINRSEDIMYLMMLQAGTVPYSDDKTQTTFDQAVVDSSNNVTFPASSALSYYTSFADPNSSNYNWNTKSNYDLDAFVNGQLGYMYGYSYFMDTIKQKAPNLNYDIAPVPQMSAGKDLVNFANYWGFAVSKQTKNVNIAWNFINSMISKQSLTDYYTRHPLPAARKDMISDQIDTNMGVFASSNLTAKSFYKADPDKVDQIFNNMIDDVNLRGTAPDQAVTSAAQKVNALNHP